METSQSKSFSLEGKRISLPFDEALRKLRIRYPRAYDLRKSITSCTPLWWKGKPAVLYEIAQDNEEGYPFFHYVLWFNDELRQIYCTTEKAALIDSQGFFFIEDHKRAVAHVSLFRESYDTPTDDRDHSDVRHWKEKKTYFKIADGFNKVIEEIRSLKICRYGLYVLAKGYQDNKTICFIRNEGTPGNFIGREFYPLQFPAYMQSWEPGPQEGFTFFSDETSIYSLKHGAVSVVIRRYTPDNPSIRLGVTHRWKHSLFLRGSGFVLIGKSNSDGNYLSDTDWLNKFQGNLNRDDRWAVIGESILVIEHTGKCEFRIDQFTDTCVEGSWKDEKLLETKSYRYTQASFKQIERHWCYFGIDGEWFLISKEDLG